MTASDRFTGQGYPTPVSANGALSVEITVLDDHGTPFNPDSCNQVGEYTGGNLTTITATEPQTGIVRVKTISYNESGQWTGATVWVRQPAA